MEAKIEALRQALCEAEKAQGVRNRQIARRIFSRTILGLAVFVAVVTLISIWK